jgi:hypothetical protein
MLNICYLQVPAQLSSWQQCTHCCCSLAVVVLVVVPDPSVAVVVVLVVSVAVLALRVAHVPQVLVTLLLALPLALDK